MGQGVWFFRNSLIYCLGGIAWGVGYEGVKFRAVEGPAGEEPFPGGTGPLDDELLGLGRFFAREGLAPEVASGWAGNLSYMRAGCMTITASGSDLSDLTRGDLVDVTGFDYEEFVAEYYGRSGEDALPSSETGMHWKLYRGFGGEGGPSMVLHGHCSAFRGVEDRMPYPATPERVPYGSKLQVELVAGVVESTDSEIVLVRDHGFVILAEDPGRAWALSREVAREKASVEKTVDSGRGGGVEDR